MFKYVLKMVWSYKKLMLAGALALFLYSIVDAYTYTTAGDLFVKAVTVYVYLYSAYGIINFASGKFSKVFVKKIHALSASLPKEEEKAKESNA